jgi:hypothetical protein
VKTLSVKVLSEKVFISYPEQRQNSSLWIFRTQLYLYICLRRFKDADRKPKQDLQPPAITLGYADPGVISLESFRAATNNRHPTELNYRAASTSAAATRWYSASMQAICS